MLRFAKQHIIRKCPCKTSRITDRSVKWAVPMYSRLDKPYQIDLTFWTTRQRYIGHFLSFSQFVTNWLKKVITEYFWTAIDLASSLRHPSLLPVPTGGLTPRLEVLSLSLWKRDRALHVERHPPSTSQMVLLQKVVGFLVIYSEFFNAAANKAFCWPCREV